MQAAERSLQRSVQERSKLSTQRDLITGRQEVLEQQVDVCNRKLNDDPNYRDVDERTRKKRIEFETTNLAVADIDSYHHALDKALQNFHTIRIKKINKIIMELWQLVYKGQDIDSIEIESGVDEGARVTRTYK
jgi:hypothetical protein